MSRATRKNPALAKATCAALIAASFAVGSPADADALQSIERYCQSSWRQAGIPPLDWEDCTQDAVLELLSRVPRQALPSAINHAASAERRELMRSIWCVAQRWRRQVQRAPISLDVLADYRDTGLENHAERIAEDELLHQAFSQLTELQRNILELSRAGHSVAEIAQQLDRTAPQVSDQKYKAIKVLQKRFQEERQLETASA